MRSSLSSGLFWMVIYSIFFSFSLFVASGQCLSTEQTLLLQLKNNLTFNSTLCTKLVTWNQSVDCCSWIGITCSDGHVIGLDLTNDSISRGLDNSSSLFGLSHLQSLNLADNNFNFNFTNSGILSQIGKLTNLRYLNLSRNDLKGQVPLEISYLSRLVVLDLSSNYYLELKNPNLSMLIRNLTELTKLHMDDVSISANDKKWCQVLSSSLPNLKELSLSNCNLSGPIDYSLQNLQFLSIIHLGFNDFSTEVPEFFGDLKNLTILDLSFSLWNGTFPKKIFQVLALQELYLSQNSLLHGSLPQFHSNNSLRTIWLDSTSFSGILPESIGNLKMLSSIDFSDCYFTGSIPKSIERLTEVVYLDLSHNHLTGKINSTRWEKIWNLKDLYLNSNLLEGNIPISLFSLQLRHLDLSSNQFSGKLNKFANISSQLFSLDLSNNSLEGSIPMSIFELQGLDRLSLSSNSFSGSVQLIGSLSYLDLSYNNLSNIENYVSNISSSPFAQDAQLLLASNNLKKIPNFLRNLTNLFSLDLSTNKIDGEMPNWICNLTKNLDLSYNFLVSLEGQFWNPQLETLNLRSNSLQGQLPTMFLEPQAIDLSHNMFYGRIPNSICNISFLEVLDLSSNSFSGTLPQCLLKLSKHLTILNLRENNFNGTISNMFPRNCQLVKLALSGNQLEGKLPKSLANCTELEMLDIGNNNIKGTFPFYLEKASALQVLILRSNQFYGSIPKLGHNGSWPMLQILDVALNNFSGKFPRITFSNWTKMIRDEHSAIPFLGAFTCTVQNGSCYLVNDEISIKIISKGFMMELVNILTIYTSLDFSCNNFNGLIPKEIGELKMLYALNLSYNAFWGPIPPSLGKLSELESLDLSSNKLTGKIPKQLADNLHFLSKLNLSFNQLEGQIPRGTQFSTFENDSFEGNKALCGFPLSSKCISVGPPLLPPNLKGSHVKPKTTIEWKYIIVELGFIFGLGVVILPLMFWRKWRVIYFQCVDNVLFENFPQFYLRGNYHLRGAPNNQRLMC